jgi:hypothetical protein
MYRIRIPRTNTTVINVLDSLIKSRSVEIPNSNISRNIGIYLKPWRKKGFISLYVEPEQKRTILVSNVDISKNIGTGRKIEFTIDDRILNNLNLRVPRI